MADEHRKTLASVLVLVGAVAICTGGFLISAVVGAFTLGVVLIALGVLARFNVEGE